MRALAVFLVVLLVFSTTGEVYRIYLDREFGFWAVRSNDANHSLNYTDKTLAIRTGDTVIWENMDSDGDRITLKSDNLLWEGGILLGRQGDTHRLTFNSSGIFKFHIVERNRIVMNASNESSVYTTVYDRYVQTNKNRTITQKVVSVKSYPYQYQYIKVSGLTVGNGTYPANYFKRTMNQSSAIKYSEKPRISVAASRTSAVIPAQASAQPSKPLESYQEFTLYEVLKRWYVILISYS